RIIANTADHVTHSYVIRIRRILRHESDMRGNAGSADRRRKIAALERALLAFGPGRPRDKANGPLDRRNVIVTLAVEGGEYRHQREPLGGQRRLPCPAGFLSQVHIARDSNLPATDSQRFHFSQRLDRVAPTPKHHTDFQILQTLHSILSPFLLLDSSIIR